MPEEAAAEAEALAEINESASTAEASAAAGQKLTKDPYMPIRWGDRPFVG